MTYDQFLQEVCPALDLAWRKYSRRSARHRVDERLRELGFKTYSDYLELLRFDTREAAGLPDLMRVTVTRFFRDEKEWRELKDRILPGLITDSYGAGKLRAWSAGCCGGEEPFSLALAWLEYLQPLYTGYALEIVATDIDDASLDRARCALYRTESLREVPPEIGSRWFSRKNGQWHLDEKATSIVRLEKSNLLTDQPPVQMDLVLCRYLAFTYYKGARLQIAVRKLWESLRPGGILMVGAKEEFPTAALMLFEQIPENRVFYRRRG